MQGTYSQDWLLYETDWNWRIDVKAGGPLRVMADIGSHWFDMAEHLTGLRVRSLCADLQTFHPTRNRPKQSVETFGGKLLTAADVEETPVHTEDFGAVLFRMGEGARGAMTASQVSAGRKNHLNIEIYGTKSSVRWDQERPDELWIGQRNSPNQIIVKDPVAVERALLPGMPICPAVTPRDMTTRSSKSSGGSISPSSIHNLPRTIRKCRTACDRSRSWNRSSRAIVAEVG